MEINKRVIMGDLTRKLHANEVKDIKQVMYNLNHCLEFGIIIPSKYLPLLTKKYRVTMTTEDLVKDSNSMCNDVEALLYKSTESVMIHSN